MSKHIKLNTLLEIRNQCKHIIANYAEFVTNYELIIKANNQWYHNWDVCGEDEFAIDDLQIVINDNQIVIDTNGTIQVNHITLTVDEMQAIIMLSSCVRLTNIN